MAKQIKEPETAANKKAAKAATGNGKGATKAVKAAKEEASAKPKGPTIGATAVELLKGGMGAKETLAEIQKRFPGCKTTMACIYWYANHNDIKLQKPAAPKKPAEQPVAKAA